MSTSGGLLQLSFKGDTDVFLVGNPDTTLWKTVYKKHTGFATESFQQVFRGQVLPDCIATADLSHHGDLVNKCYIVAKTTGYVNHISEVIKQAELYIGEQLIDKHQGEFLDIWYKLSIPKSQQNGFLDMKKHVEEKRKFRGLFVAIVKKDIIHS